MVTPKRSVQRGFTLVELMIVVAIIGVLASLAIYGVRRYLASAKTAEAKNSVGTISRYAQAAFERETTEAEMLGDAAQSNASSHSLCKSAANPVPPAVPLGKKYQPSSSKDVDFDTGDVTKGWKCLKFVIGAPIYFQYNYRQGDGYVSAGLPGAPAPGANGFEASAKGDLDGNGVESTLAMSGNVGANNHLRIATQVFVHDELE